MEGTPVPLRPRKSALVQSACRFLAAQNNDFANDDRRVKAYFVL